MRLVSRKRRDSVSSTAAISYFLLFYALELTSKRNYDSLYGSTWAIPTRWVPFFMGFARA
jgi:hypothetical protein